MNLSSWDRYSPLAAIGTVILWAAGIFTIESGDAPEEGNAAQAVAYFEDDRMTIYVGAMLVMAGALLLIWHVANLREAVLARAPQSTRLGSVVFGGGLAAAIFAMGLPVAQIGGAFAGEEEGQLEPGAAQALYFASDGFFIATMYGAALLVLSTAVAILVTGLFPRWLAWVSILLGIWLLIAPIGWLALIFVFPLWLIVTSVLLWRQMNALAMPMPATSTPLE
jgi:hypothetical protein